MSSFGWLQVVYLLMVLGLFAGSYRAHRIGGKRSLVYVLVWLAIFVLAALVADVVTSEGIEQGDPYTNLT